MDRGELSAAIVEEMGDLFVTALREIAPRLAAADLDGIEQQLQDLGRRVFGDVVEHTVAAIAAAQPPARPLCPQCGQPMRLVDAARPRQLQGLVGDYRLVRAYYVCPPCHHGLAPLDRRLGLGVGALSPGLSRVACRVGIDQSFAEAADLLRETVRVEVAAEAVRRITEGIGAVAEAEQQAAVALAQTWRLPAPEQAAPAMLVVEVDGVMIHWDDDWHEGKVGVVAPLGPATWTDPESGRVGFALGPQSVCAGLEPAAAFWWRVHCEACRRGLGAAAVVLVVVLGDGAEWIWHAARHFLKVGRAEVVEIVDIFHAWEHLWKVANAVFGAGSAKAAAWAEPLKRRLEQEGPGPVLAALEQLVPPDEAATEEVRKATGDFTDHTARMDYPRFVARQLPIGSGAVESTCKTLVQAREKGAGMRWSHTGAQAVASLRAVHRSGRWQAFWQTHPGRRRPAVFPRRPPPESVPGPGETRAA
jgi:hypothetical protein